MNQTLKEIDFHSWFSFLVFTLNSIIVFSAQHASNICPWSSAAFAESDFVFVCFCIYLLKGFVFMRLKGFAYMYVLGPEKNMCCRVFICVLKGYLFVCWKVRIFLLKGFLFVCWKVLYLCIEIFLFVCCGVLYLCIERFCICVMKNFVCVFKGFLSVCWKVSISREGQWTKSSSCWNAQNLQLHRVSSSNCCTRSTRLSPDIWFHCQPSIAGQGWQRRPSLCKYIVKNAKSGFFIGQQSWWSPQQYFKPSFLSDPSPIIALPIKKVSHCSCWILLKLLHFSKLLHGFVNIYTGISLSWYMDFS